MLFTYLKAFDSPRKGSSRCRTSKRERDAFIISQGLRWRMCPNKITVIKKSFYSLSYLQLKYGQHLNSFQERLVCKISTDDSSRLHENRPANVPGDPNSIYNDESKELFTYHWDTQIGVGERYNLSYGLIPCTDKAKIKNYGDMIPGWCYCKKASEACDNFNRALHGRCWPHKRGGRNLPGNIWNHHDFIQADILENIINACFFANVRSHSRALLKS